MRTNLEHYLKASVQMLLARLDGDDKEEDSILDELDVLWEKLSPEEMGFIETFKRESPPKAEPESQSPTL